jgi:tripartite-type tricarboxylate transporter receptor subunit TctC
MTFANVPRLLGLCATLALATPALAQDADALAKLFRDKNVTIGIGSSAGGGLDTYGRLVSRHLGKHLPGNPSVVVSNMPGAGGNVVANNLWTTAPKDGTFMGITFPSVIIDPLLAENHRGYDPTKFAYVGNANAEVLVCLVRRDAPAKKPEDVLSNEIIIGATAPGSTTSDFPVIEKGLLGAKYRIVTGYQGSREVTLAVEKGEVQGICGLGWSTVKVQYPDVLKGSMPFGVFAQEDVKGHPELNALGVPLMMSLAKTEEDRRAMTMFLAQNAFSRPFILPAGVAPDRVALMRKAFAETIADPELQEDAHRMNIDAVPTSGEELQKTIDAMYATPKTIVERVRKSMGR